MITDHQIQLLQDEAFEHGDEDTTIFCEIALWGRLDQVFLCHGSFRRETVEAYKNMTVEDARERCKEMIEWNHREGEEINQENTFEGRSPCTGDERSHYLCEV